MYYNTQIQYLFLHEYFLKHIKGQESNFRTHIRIEQFVTQILIMFVDPLLNNVFVSSLIKSGLIKSGFKHCSDFLPYGHNKWKNID